MKFDKLATIICFIGLSCPLWLSLLIVIAFTAHTPGFRHDPMQPDTTEYYQTLPARMKYLSDSLKK